MTGASGAYSGSVQIASPQLKADYTSDSRAGSIGVVSGASVWLAASTDVGAKYGSSRHQQYLNLRPRADNASSPSETTYTFARPTPTANWTFVLGDIDADQVRIRAVGPAGNTLAWRFGGAPDIDPAWRGLAAVDFGSGIRAAFCAPPPEA